MSAHPQDDLLAALVDGSLSAADRDAVEAHLRACEQCRAEVQLARGAHAALRDLPDELDVPMDVAGAVLAETGLGGPAGSPAGSRSGKPATVAPRWYRAAAIVAAAAFVALGVFALPRLGGEGDQQAIEAGTGSVPRAAAGSAPAPTTQDREYDDVSLAGLASREAAQAKSGKLTFDSLHAGDASAPNAASSASTPAPSGVGLPASESVAARAATCVREAAAHPLVAADAVPPEAALARSVIARFEGSDAIIGTFLVGPSGAPDSVILVAAARDDCRFLGSAEHGI